MMSSDIFVLAKGLHLPSPMTFSYMFSNLV